MGRNGRQPLGGSPPMLDQFREAGMDSPVPWPHMELMLRTFGPLPAAFPRHRPRCLQHNNRTERAMLRAAMPLLGEAGCDALLLRAELVADSLQLEPQERWTWPDGGEIGGSEPVRYEYAALARLSSTVRSAEYKAALVNVPWNLIPSPAQ